MLLLLSLSALTTAHAGVSDCSTFTGTLPDSDYSAMTCNSACTLSTFIIDAGDTGDTGDDIIGTRLDCDLDDGMTLTSGDTPFGMAVSGNASDGQEDLTFVWGSPDVPDGTYVPSSSDSFCCVIDDELDGILLSGSAYDDHLGFRCEAQSGSPSGFAQCDAAHQNSEDGVNRKAVIRARAGDDTLYGSNEDLGPPLGTDYCELLSGGDGDDTIDGNGGVDRLRGGEDSDTINGGGGGDFIFGGPGDGDVLDGGSGADVIGDGDGDDEVLLGGTGNDVLCGSGTNVVISGQGTNDDLFMSSSGTLSTSSVDSSGTNDCSQNIINAVSANPSINVTCNGSTLTSQPQECVDLEDTVDFDFVCD